MPIIVPYPPVVPTVPTTGADDLLASGKAAVEALMTDHCILREQVEPDDWSMGADLRLTPSVGAGQVIYSGKFKFRSEDSSGSAEVIVGDDPAVETRYRVDLPLSAPKLAVGMTVEVTACPRDPAAVGMLMEITEPTYKTMTIKRTAVATVRTQPEGA